MWVYLMLLILGWDYYPLIRKHRFPPPQSHPVDIQARACLALV